MKVFGAFLLTLALIPTCMMAAVEKMYYAGEAKLSSPAGQSYGSQAFLLEKIHDPENNLIVERAVVVKPDQSVEEFTMHLKVKGNSFTINESTGCLRPPHSIAGDFRRSKRGMADRPLPVGHALLCGL